MQQTEQRGGGGKQEPTEPGTKSRQTSISGGLPLLLLSVLPPVIPRASWPSAEHMTIPMRRSVTFSSEPHMEDGGGDDSRLPAIDLLNLRLRHQKCMENKTIFDKIKGIFGASRAPSRKESTSSVSGSGIAAAFKAHMGLITGLVPNTNTGSSSCHTLNVNYADPKVLRRPSLARSGTAINIEITEPEFEGLRVFKVTDELEPRVNFNLPANRRSSVLPNQPPTLRERIKGSPRFPHRILPTCSLNTLTDEPKVNGNFF